MDKWDGYVASRERLYARLKETKAPNPIVLSGDVHVHYGADLKLDFANPRSETVGVEFTNTSVTSGADGADVSATWERIRGDNPHIKYHSARRGYIACTATPADHAGRLQDPRPGHGARCRLSAPAARSSSRPAARGRRWGRPRRRRPGDVRCPRASHRRGRRDRRGLWAFVLSELGVLGGEMALGQLKAAAAGHFVVVLNFCKKPL